MKLIAIGGMGEYEVFVDVTREEAIRRFDELYPDYTVAENSLNVREIDVPDGRFWVYDIEERHDG